MAAEVFRLMLLSLVKGFYIPCSAVMLQRPSSISYFASNSVTHPLAKLGFPFGSLSAEIVCFSTSSSLCSELLFSLDGFN
jgi:hypothetical protein